MARRQRDRRGRFLKRGRKTSTSRKRGRRSNPGKRRARGSRKRGRRSGSRRRRSRPRASNPPARRRRRRSSGRRRNSPRARYRTRHVYHRRRRSNPPYTLKTVLIGLALIGAGFGLAYGIPMLIVKLAKKPAWQMGWKRPALAAGSTVLVAAVGYGIGRAFFSKRTANYIAGELAIGGTIAVIVESVQAWRAHKPAAQQQAQAPQPGGERYFSPKQLENAAAAANVVRRGQGYFSPDAYARATTGGALMTAGDRSSWTKESNF